MRDNQDQRDTLRRRIGENQRRATELSIELKLESQDKDDVSALSETAARLEAAVETLEKARLVLASA
ncbi:MAG TPA: hypothetical protein VLS25_03130 [Dehalococcoidia bacterium]|nr:hypothetical protein [Dehalococcoidia bacterium]